MKKVLLSLFCIVMVLGGFIVSPHFLRTQTDSTARAVNVQPINNSVFQHITLTSYGQNLTTDNFSTINNSSYIYCKYNITITFNNPFDNAITNYDLSDVNNFIIVYNEIDFSDAEITTKNKEIVVNGQTFTCEYKIDQLNQLELRMNNNIRFNIGPSTHNLFSFDYDTKKLSYISSITWKSSSEDSFCDLEFRSSTSNVIFRLNFCKAIAILNGDAFLNYNCIGYDAGESYTYTKLPEERVYKKVELEFYTTYTESNPLFMDVDYNGFIFKFKLFTTSAGQLILNYIETNQNIAENYIEMNGVITHDNTFKLIFNKLGRYGIKFYDSSYLNKTDFTLSNFTETSFYIIDDETNAYNNVYSLFQSYTDNTDYQYIASASAQEAAYPIMNKNVKVIVKNLDKLTDADKDNLVVKIFKTIYTGTSQMPTEYTYTARDLINNYNCELDFEEDAYYKVQLEFNNSSFKDYQFEIIKNVKASFNIDGKSFPRGDEVAFTKYSETFTRHIFYNMSISSQLSDLPIVNHGNIAHDFENSFIVYYGKKGADISVYKDESGMLISFKGVGTIHARVTFGGKTTSHTFLEGDSRVLVFTEYGTYKIEFYDEMDTQVSQTITYSKPLNTSTILLVAISGLILAMIAVFVLISRRKIATR